MVGVVVVEVVFDAAFNNAFISTSSEHELATPVPSHLGVRLPATPAPSSNRALTVVSARMLEKLALNSATTGGARKMTQNASKRPHTAAMENS